MFYLTVPVGDNAAPILISACRRVLWWRFTALPGDYVLISEQPSD